MGRSRWLCISCDVVVDLDASRGSDSDYCQDDSDKNQENTCSQGHRGMDYCCNCVLDMCHGTPPIVLVDEYLPCWACRQRTNRNGTPQNGEEEVEKEEEDLSSQTSGKDALIIEIEAKARDLHCEMSKYWQSGDLYSIVALDERTRDLGSSVRHLVYHTKSGFWHKFQIVCEWHIVAFWDKHKDCPSLLSCPKGLFNMLGTAYQKLDQFDDALRVFNELFELMKLTERLRDPHNGFLDMASFDKPVIRLGQMFNSMGKVYTSLGRLEEAETMYTKTLNITTEAAGGRGYKGDDNHAKDVVESWIELANIYSIKRRHNRAIAMYANALEFQELLISSDTKESKDENKNEDLFCLILKQVGNEYISMGCFDQAVEVLDKILEVCGEEDRLNKIAAYTGLGQCHANKGEHRYSVDMHEMALKLTDHTCDVLVQRITLENLGQSYLLLGRFEDAEVMFTKALKLETKANESTYQGLASAFRFLGRLEEAVDMLKEQIAMLEAGGDVIRQGIVLNNLVATFVDLGKHQDALHHVSRSISLFKRAQQSKGLKEDEDRLLLAELDRSFRLLQSICLALGRPGSALAAAELSKSTALTDSEFLFDVDHESSKDLTSQHWQMVQMMAREKRCTVVEYSTLLDNTLIIWVISSDGEVICQHHSRTDMSDALGIIGPVSQALELIKSSEQCMISYSDTDSDKGFFAISGEWSETCLRMEEWRAHFDEIISEMQTIEGYIVPRNPECIVAQIATILSQRLHPISQDAHSTILEFEAGRRIKKASMQRTRGDKGDKFRKPVRIPMEDSTFMRQKHILMQWVRGAVDESLGVQEWLHLQMKTFDLTPSLNEEAKAFMLRLSKAFDTLRGKIYRWQDLKFPREDAASHEKFSNWGIKDYDVRCEMLKIIRRLFSHKRILRELHKALIAPVAEALEGVEDLLIIPHKSLFAVPWAALLDEDGTYLIQRHSVRVSPSLQVAQSGEEMEMQWTSNSSCPLLRVLLYGNLGIGYQKLGLLEHSVAMHAQAMMISERTGNVKLIGTTQVNLAKALLMQSEEHCKCGDLLCSAEVEVCMSKLASTLELETPQISVGLFQHLSLMYQRMGRLGESIVMYFSCLKIAKLHGYITNECQAKVELGAIYRSLGEYHGAVSVISEALEIAEQLGDEKMKGKAYGELGQCHQNLGRFADAFDLHSKRLQIAKYYGDVFEEGAAYGGMGYAYMSKKKLMQQKEASFWTENGNHLHMSHKEQLLFFHNKHLEYMEKAGDVTGQAFAYLGLGYAQDLDHEWNESTIYLSHALTLAERIGDTKISALARHKLAHVQEWQSFCRKMNQSWGNRKDEDDLTSNEKDKSASTGLKENRVKLMSNAILTLQQASLRLGPADDSLRISLLATQERMYQVLTDALLDLDRDGPAMAVAGTGKAQALFYALNRTDDNIQAHDVNADDLDFAEREWHKVQKMARAERCTIIEYRVDGHWFGVWVVSSKGELVRFHSSELKLGCTLLGLEHGMDSPSGVILPDMITEFVENRTNPDRKKDDYSIGDFSVSKAVDLALEVMRARGQGGLSMEFDEDDLTFEGDLEIDTYLSENVDEDQVEGKQCLLQMHPRSFDACEPLEVCHEETKSIYFKTLVSSLRNKMDLIDWNNIEHMVMRFLRRSGAEKIMPKAEEEKMRMWLTQQVKEWLQVQTWLVQFFKKGLGRLRRGLSADNPSTPSSIEFMWADFCDKGEIIDLDVVLCEPEKADSDLMNADQIKGKMAVAIRGGCSFQEKVQRVIAAGALALVIVSNTNTLSVAGSSDRYFAEIPVVMIKAKDAKALLLSGKSSSLSSIRDDESDEDEDDCLPRWHMLAKNVNSWKDLSLLTNFHYLRRMGVSDQLTRRCIRMGIKIFFSHDRILRELHETLIAPIAEALEGVEDLLIIPHKSLFAVPWAALLDEDGTYLIQRHSIRVAPSLRVARSVAEKTEVGLSSRKAVVVGNPFPNAFGPIEGLLEGAEVEARLVVESLCDSASGINQGEIKAIRENVVCDMNMELKTVSSFGLDNVRMLLRTSATKDAVLSSLNGVHWAHVACHGNLQTDTHSLLMASAEGGKDGEIFMHDLQHNLRLGPGSTIVLSACDSGRGRIQAEGVIGLARGFFWAGAGAVVASLWQIDDHSTKELMLAFYKHLQQGLLVHKAMQRAMLDLIHSTKVSISAGSRAKIKDLKTKDLKTSPSPPPWANPLHWGAFVVIGAHTCLRSCANRDNKVSMSVEDPHT